MHIFIFNLTFYIFDLTEPLIYKRFIYRVFCGLSKVFLGWCGSSGETWTHSCISKNLPVTLNASRTPEKSLRFIFEQAFYLPVQRLPYEFIWIELPVTLQRAAHFRDDDLGG